MTISPIELILFGIAVWMLGDGLTMVFGGNWMQRMLRWLSEQPPEDLRQAGLISAAIGATLIYGILRF